MGPKHVAAAGLIMAGSLVAACGQPGTTGTASSEPPRTTHATTASTSTSSPADKRTALAPRSSLLPSATHTASAPASVPASTSASPRATANTPTATATAGASPSRRTADHSVTVVMNGDLLWHNTLWYGAHEDAVREGHRGRDDYDFPPLLAGMKPVISGADLAICHEEVPLAPRGGPYRNYPRFAAPPQVVAAIKSTGYDLCTTSSNHSVDQGFAGIRRTLDALDRAGIEHVGSYRSEQESRTPTIFTTSEGVKIAVVSATFSLNGLPMPHGRPWAVNRLSAAAVLAQARRARAAGADIVLAALHAGTEYSSTENAQQVAVARALTASADVDLVYMHHVHVVQPWTKINGKWVVYGLGNTVAQHATDVPRGYEGVTGRFTFVKRGGRFVVDKAEYIPTLVTHYQPGKPARLHRISTALRTATGAWRQRLLAAERRTRAVVTRKHPAGLIEG
jgi:poly-gamma-glutamate capsule biosynthesis protein CapA/YwtB (metallophosphatase superfamily)